MDNEGLLDLKRKLYLSNINRGTALPSDILWSPTSSVPGLPTPSGSSSSATSSATVSATPSPSSSRRQSSSDTSHGGITRQTLDALEKPVRFVPLNNSPSNQLPRNILHLYNRIYGITVERSAFLPSEALTSIVLALDTPPAASWFKKADGNGPDSKSHQDVQWLRDQVDAFKVHDTLREIQVTAQECLALGRSQAAWNLEVHAPLLKIALHGCKHVGSEYMQSARIEPSFTPQVRYPNVGALLDDDMCLDFALVLMPAGNDYRVGTQQPKSDGDKRDEKLAAAMTQVIMAQPLDEQSINPTLYTPLKYRPMAVNIATTVNRSAEEARLQLATWAAAWHGRMSSLIDRVLTSRGKEVWPGKWHRPIMTLPLIHIIEHQWHLSFACDKVDRLEIVGSMVIGDTCSILGLYTLVAVIQELAIWIEGPFRDWFRNLFGPY